MSEKGTNKNLPNTLLEDQRVKVKAGAADGQAILPPDLFRQSKSFGERIEYHDGPTYDHGLRHISPTTAIVTMAAIVPQGDIGVIGYRNFFTFSKQTTKSRGGLPRVAIEIAIVGLLLGIILGECDRTGCWTAINQQPLVLDLNSVTRRTGQSLDVILISARGKDVLYPLCGRQIRHPLSDGQSGSSCGLRTTGLPYGYRMRAPYRLS